MGNFKLLIIFSVVAFLHIQTDHPSKLILSSKFGQFLSWYIHWILKGLHKLSTKQTNKNAASSTQYN